MRDNIYITRFQKINHLNSLNYLRNKIISNTYYVCIMSEEFIYHTSNFDDWKQNKLINRPDLDPLNENKLLVPFSYD